MKRKINPELKNAVMILAGLLTAAFAPPVVWLLGMVHGG